MRRRARTVEGGAAAGNEAAAAARRAPIASRAVWQEDEAVLFGEREGHAGHARGFDAHRGVVHDA